MSARISVSPSRHKIVNALFDAASPRITRGTSTGRRGWCWATAGTGQLATAPLPGLTDRFVLGKAPFADASGSDGLAPLPAPLITASPWHGSGCSTASLALSLKHPQTAPSARKGNDCGRRFLRSTSTIPGAAYHGPASTGANDRHRAGSWSNPHLYRSIRRPRIKLTNSAMIYLVRVDRMPSQQRRRRENRCPGRITAG